MSSNQKKQDVNTDKKKLSFFNFGKSRASAPAGNTGPPPKTEPTAIAVDIVDTKVNAAVLHATRTDNTSDKPTSSGRVGQIRKLANFFKRGNAAKVVKPVNAESEDVPLSGMCPAASGQCQMEALPQKDNLSLKEGRLK